MLCVRVWCQGSCSHCGLHPNFILGPQRPATTMPGNCSKKSQDCDWTFNFRTSSYFFDDSESDTETAQLNDKDTVASTAPAKDRLLDGIDLSTREETVVYKPNPFSIAKINAANRAQNQEHRALTQGRQNTSGGSPLRRPLKLVPKPIQTTVLDGFKIQAQKASLPTRPAASLVKRSQVLEASKARVLAQKPSSHRVPNVASVSPLNSESGSSNIPTQRHTEGQYANPFPLLNRILYFILCPARSCPQIFLSKTRIYQPETTAMQVIKRLSRRTSKKRYPLFLYPKIPFH